MEKETRKGLSPEYLKEQISLPSSEWSEEFRAHIREKESELADFVRERTPAERRELAYRMQLGHFGLTEGDIRGKRVIDLGCGEEGDFVKAALDKGVSAEVFGVDGQTMIPEPGYEGHFAEANYFEEIPWSEADYIVSNGSVSNYPLGENIEAAKKLFRNILDHLKNGGEARIFPYNITSPEVMAELPGIAKTNETLASIMEEMKDEVEWERRPVEIYPSPNTGKVWLKELLRIKKK